MPGVKVPLRARPWLADRAVWPLMGVVGIAGGYVSYTIGMALAWNPDVQLNRAYRSAAVGSGKWEVDPSLSDHWFKRHQAFYRHKDRTIESIHLWEPFSAKYWEERAAVARDPESYTQSGTAARMH